ncbi:hypothetical protein PPTG_24877 [Phytophthora nicotianae INRA-310]|uniref:Uncharacterized protein n=1 Tax=Phytophthora nicotianae (strain INRA-310) TaxID=761204 RepID=W2PCB6_PHYN3|nr:hypothetical protein PPTG_24877 [Phytophthora nicotianae INRA-310]ETM97654.1 hypothetical protein PPTG_24877 [Phytophthora nicotianae INRA-310]
MDATYKLTHQQQQHHSDILGLLRRVYAAVSGKSLHVRIGIDVAAQWNALQEVFSPDNHFTFLMCNCNVA